MDLGQIREGFEEQYFIPSHIKYCNKTNKYVTKYEGEIFSKLAMKINNMFFVWKDACLFCAAPEDK